MASLLGEQLFQLAGQGPPPAKDFFQLEITRNQVIWTSWTISLRRENRGAPPKQLRATHKDFLCDKMLQYEVGTVFGERILNYTLSLCKGKFDYLERLPDDTMLRILSYLELKDIAQLAQVSPRLNRLCNSENFWEQHVRNFCVGFTSDMEALANAMGWRRSFFTFFHKSGCEVRGFKIKGDQTDRSLGRATELLKYSNDSAVLLYVSDEQEAEHRQLVDHFLTWGGNYYIVSSVNKTKEIILNARISSQKSFPSLDKSWGRWRATNNLSFTWTSELEFNTDTVYKN